MLHTHSPWVTRDQGSRARWCPTRTLGSTAGGYVSISSLGSPLRNAARHCMLEQELEAEARLHAQLV